MHSHGNKKGEWKRTLIEIGFYSYLLNINIVSLLLRRSCDHILISLCKYLHALTGIVKKRRVFSFYFIILLIYYETSFISVYSGEIYPDVFFYIIIKKIYKYV
jgi:hypothetical protein